MRKRNFWQPSNEKQEKINVTKAALCRAIMKAAQKHGYSRRQMAVYMGTTKANVSLVENSRVERLSLNLLFRYLVNLEPNFELLISI